MQGRSLLPILTNRSDPSRHRDWVRCEYYDALDLPDRSLATMLRTPRYKLVVYHGHGLGELYDLAEDPDEFLDLWDSPEHQELKLELVLQSYDATIMAMDRGPRRIGPM
jgi:arylsulfatase